MSKDNIQQAPFDFFEKGYILGFQYRIIQHNIMGHLCGYIRLPRTHPLYKAANRKRLRYPFAYYRIGAKKVAQRKGYCAKGIEALRVHGGVTYAGTLSASTRGYWIGFDCGHYGDLSPGMPIHTQEGTFRTPEYVRKELQLLAAQVSMCGTPALQATLTLLGATNGE